MRHYSLQGVNFAKSPMYVNRLETINMPQTPMYKGFEACHVNRLIDFRKNGCAPKGWNVWGMCVESQNRLPTLQTLYTWAFQAIYGEWGTQRSFDHQQIRCQSIDSRPLDSRFYFSEVLFRSLSSITLTTQHLAVLSYRTSTLSPRCDVVAFHEFKIELLATEWADVFLLLPYC